MPMAYGLRETFHETSLLALRRANRASLRLVGGWLMGDHIGSPIQPPRCPLSAIRGKSKSELNPHGGANAIVVFDRIALTAIFIEEAAEGAIRDIRGIFFQ